MRRRRILMAVLAVGSVLGFSLGIAHLRHGCSNEWRGEHRAASGDCAEHGRSAPVDETR